MKPGLKLFGLPVQEYYNQAGATVFEVHGTIKELQPIYKDIRKTHLNKDHPPLIIPDGRVLYIKCCHAITNMLDFNEITVIRIITSEEPIVSKSHKRDKNTFYKEAYHGKI